MLLVFHGHCQFILDPKHLKRGHSKPVLTFCVAAIFNQWALEWIVCEKFDLSAGRV